MREDIRYALRTIVRNSGLFVVVVLTLAIAIAAATTMFSFVDAVLLKPLPFGEPGRLVALWDSNPDKDLEKNRVSPFNFLHWREESDAFDRIALYSSSSFTLTGVGEAIRFPGTSVSEDFFPLLGVQPLQGRSFVAEDFDPAAEPVVLLSHALWTTHLGSDPGVVGRQLTLNGSSYTVVGVLPEQIIPQAASSAGEVLFTAGEPHLWSVLKTIPEHHGHVFGVLARLRPGVTVAGARAQLSAIARSLEEEFPDSNQGYGVKAVPLTEEVMGDVATPLWMLLGAVGLLLAIACVNVINLLLVRTSARERELAVRAAMGTDRKKLLRLFLVESVFLVLPGVALGLVLASWSIRLLADLVYTDVPRLTEALVDLRVLAAAAGLGLFTFLIFTLAPLLQVRWRRLEAALHAGGKSAGGRREGSRLRRLLVAVEMTMAVMLVLGSTLLIKSFERLQDVELGISAERVLLFELQLPSSLYPEMHHLTSFFDELLGEIRALPGVTAAAAAYDHPLASNWSQSFTVEGAPEPAPDDRPSALFRTVTPGYLETVGLHLLRGRDVVAGDTADAPGAVIISQELARRHFPDGSPLGQRLSISTTPWMWGDAIPDSFEIVGVVEDVRSTGLTGDVEPAFYIPYAQTPHHGMTILVQTTGEPRSVLPAVRQRLQALAPTLPASGVTTLGEVHSEMVARPRFTTVVLGAFAVVSLLLAMVGLWGVVQQGVLQRRREIGVRMALGADGGNIHRWMLWNGLQPVSLGLIAGIAGALALQQVLTKLLFGISATDPATYAQVAVGLLLVSLLACLLPARRAARTDPMTVLRDG